MRQILFGAVFLAVAATGPAMAQFIGPEAATAGLSVAEAGTARPGTYVTLDGNIVARLRENYYTFQDATGAIRVEIEAGVFQNRPVGPETRVRLRGEVDTGWNGVYVWVETLEILP